MTDNNQVNVVNKLHLGANHVSGNNLLWIILTCDMLFPDWYLHLTILYGQTTIWVSEFVRHKPGCSVPRSRLEAWNFGFKKKSDYTIHVAKTKALISCTVDLCLCFRICILLLF